MPPPLHHSRHLGTRLAALLLILALLGIACAGTDTVADEPVEDPAQDLALSEGSATEDAVSQESASEGDAAPSDPAASEPTSSASNPDPTEDAAADTGADGPLTVVDGTGTEVTLDAPAERIVCLDGTCVDALAELGLPPVASQPPGTVEHPAFFGPDVETAPISGTFFEPSLEDIAAAEPDLVVGGAGVHGPLRDALAGIAPLYTQRVAEPAAAVDNLMNMGVLTGRTAEAEEAAVVFEDALAAYGPGERDRTVLSMYGGATADIGIDAADSLLGQILDDYTPYPWPEAGEGTSGFLEFNIEGILDTDPEAIFVLDFGFDPNSPPLVEQLAEEPLWQELSAVQDGAVYEVDDRWWGKAYGTRALVLYLDEVLPRLYPEEFDGPLGE